MKQHSAEHTSHQIATGRTQTIAIVRSLHGRHIFFLPRYHLSWLDCVPQKLVEVLTFDTCACGFIWKSSLCRCQQAMMRSHWIRFGPNPMTSVLLRGSFGHREDGQVTTEAETKVTPPQSEKGLGPPGAGRGKEGCSPGDGGGSGLPASRTAGQWLPAVFSACTPPGLCYFVTPETNATME